MDESYRAKHLFLSEINLSLSWKYKEVFLTPFLITILITFKDYLKLLCQVGKIVTHLENKENIEKIHPPSCVSFVKPVKKLIATAKLNLHSMIFNQN